MDKAQDCGTDSAPTILLSRAQLDEFKAEGVVAIPRLVPDDVLDGWQAQIRAACTDGVNLCDPKTWSIGRYAPPSGWPKLSPNLYDLPGLRSIVQQIGGGAFAPSHPAGEPWTPQVPMTRVILPSSPGTEWKSPVDGHLDGYAAGWGGGFMALFAVLLWNVDSPMGGGTAYWPRSHLANHRYFLEHPERIDGSYLFTEPVRSGGHRALIEGDPDVGKVVCMTGRAGDAMLLHGLTTHVGSANTAGSRQPRVAQFARYSHREMREQAPMVMFPDKDGTPWSPPAPTVNQDKPGLASHAPAQADVPAPATGFLSSRHPGRRLTRYDVPRNLWKYWAPAINCEPQPTDTSSPN